MINDAASVLERCIHPVDLGTFFSDYWEKETLIVKRGEAGYFRDLLSLDAVDRMLTSTNLRVPGFRLVRQGSQIPTSEYTTRVSMTPSAFDALIDVDRVYALYQEGATIVLQALERSWAPIIELCKGLEAFLGHPVQANMYLTPANAQGFAAHHDTHDTLILQVEGRKRWKIYDMPFPFPLPDQGSLPPGVDQGPVVHDMVLEAGDTLYMPRGVIHEALTSDSYSMHITVGLKVWTWYDAVERIAQRALDACAMDVEFRRSLPLRFADGDREALTRELGDRLERFKKQLRTEGMAEELANAFVKGRWAYRRGQLTDLYRLDDLSMDSTLRRRHHALARVSDAGENVVLSFQGKRIVFPEHAREAVQFVAGRDEFRIGEIPDVLDEAGKLVLARRLIREGLLTPVEDAG